VPPLPLQTAWPGREAAPLWRTVLPPSTTTMWPLPSVCQLIVLQEILYYNINKKIINKIKIKIILTKKTASQLVDRFFLNNFVCFFAKPLEFFT
jgi:hypothetical protein